MTVVSLSLPPEMIAQMEEIRKSRGFAGRSELVRAGIRLLMDDTKEKDSLAGKVSALIVVTHNQQDEAPITKLKHEFEDIVRTHIHNKTGRANCVELFLVEGEGFKVGAMTKAFQREERMKRVRLVVI